MQNTDLLPQFGDQVGKRRLPGIHLYYPHACDDFIHGPNPGIRESCGLTPEGDRCDR